jgi:hypothetical protein
MDKLAPNQLTRLFLEIRKVLIIHSGVGDLFDKICQRLSYSLDGDQDSPRYPCATSTIRLHSVRGLVRFEDDSSDAFVHS